MIGVIWVITDLRHGTYQNWAFRPGGLLLSMATLSTVLLFFLTVKKEHKGLNRWLRFALSGCLFSIGWIVLSDVFVLILERFFRLEEHLVITDFGVRWWQSYDRFLWGLLLFVLYTYFGRLILENKEIKFLQSQQKALQKELSSMSLLSLRRELNPHFLHNAMNSIAMMVRIKKYNEATDMIAHLNDFLRAALSRNTDLRIPLTDELHLLDQYLRIEMIRFGDHVRVEKEIDETTGNVLVPQLILQPVVENVFKHGVRQSVDSQSVRIKAMLEGNYLMLSVLNTSSISRSKLYNSNQTTIGLKNITDRLRYLYGSNFKFQILQLAEGFEVKITIPSQ